MPVVDILRHLLCHDDFVGLQQIGVAISGFGRDLERDMQELTHVGVEFGMAGNMSQRTGQPWPRPAIDRRAARQLAAINVDHTGIRSAQFIDMFQCVRINLLRQRKSVAAGFSQSDQFFQPRSASGLDVLAPASPIT